MRLGIQTKWALFNLMAVGLALGPASFITITQIRSHLEKAARSSAENIAAVLAGAIGEQLFAGDDLTLQQHVDNIQKNQGEAIRYALILNKEGRVVALHPFQTEVANTRIPEEVRSDAAALATKLAVPTEDLMPVRRDVFFLLGGKNENVGSVLLGYSTAPQRAAIQDFTNLLTAFSLGGLLIGVVAGILFARRVAKPVLKLSELAGTVAKGKFDVDAPVTSRDELGELARSFNSMTAFLRKGQFMRHAFERYVSADLADRLEKDPKALDLKPGERKEVTILFLDVRGFTKRAEKMSAEDVVKFLVALFDRVSEPVFKAEGMIDKFIGDAMLSVFGFPIAHEDDPFRAVVAAVRIQEDIRAYNRERVAWGLEPVGVGVGINTGIVVAGNIGCQRKLEYTVIGDAVNVAARLVALAQPGQILVSGSTYERIQTALDAKFLGMQQVKGREQPVAVYEVNGLVYGKPQTSAKPIPPAA